MSVGGTNITKAITQPTPYFVGDVINVTLVVDARRSVDNRAHAESGLIHYAPVEGD
jgi:hypothetical protein